MQIQTTRTLTRQLAFALASSVISLSALAADLYVSPGGNDSSAGTASAPLKTIQRAAALVKAGTVVHVAAGTYSGNVSTKISGTATARVRYISDTKWGAKIIGTGTEAMWTNSGSYTDIVGFDITGPGRLGILNNASNTLISSNHVHNLALSGGCTGNGGAGIVDANYSAADDDIVSNVVHDIGTPGGCNGVQGIYHSNLRGRILNNIVYRASSFGIHLWHAANNVTIVNNTVFNNGSTSMGGGILLGDGDSPGGVVLNNTRVSNNLVYNNPRSGISEYCYSGQNCIGSSNTIANNLVYGNGGGNISLKVGTHTGTIVADPKFVNYQANGTGDYHLQSTSPAIDKGSPTSAPATDLGGNSRPQGAGYDIGAYEFMSGSQTQNPTLGATASPTALTFASQTVGTTSAIQVVTLKNTGTTSIKIPAAFVMTGDFAFGGSGTCSTSAVYAPGASCTASVVFKPTNRGTRMGSLSMTTSASSNPMVETLTGTGM